MNLPNKISISRIIATPIFLIFLVPGYFGQFLGISEWGRIAATVIFIIASMTDWIDGYIARKYNLVTNLGKFLDPIADKLLVTAALIALVMTDDLSVWAVFIIVAREFIVTGIRVVASEQGIVIAASNIAKWKTTFQIIAIILLLLRNYPISLITDFNVGLAVMWIAVVLTVISGWDYLVKNAHVMKAH